MKDKINVAELLRDCPSGMELYSPIFGKVYLDKIRPHLAIVVTIDKEQSDLKEEFLYDGRYGMNGECMLFPSKGKTTWEGFVPPCNCKFKDGDVITCTNSVCSFVAIFKEENTDITFRRYVSLTLDPVQQFWTEEGWCDFSNPRFATEEEKQKLFQAIKDNGYKWNEETNTLERLIEHKFKVGDTVIPKDFKNKSRVINAILDNEYNLFGGGKIPFNDQDNWELEKSVKPEFKVGDIIQDMDAYKVKITEINIGDECYGYESIIAKGIGSIPFNEQGNWKLVRAKFDIDSLVPFESKVLVRDESGNIWKPAIFGCCVKDKYAPYYVLGGTCWSQCIPYEGNEHLRGKTDDCDEYFKIWE